MSGAELKRLHLRVMDSAGEPTVTELPVHELTLLERLRRGGFKLLAVGGVGAVLAVLPLMHACGALTLLVVTPVVVVLTLRARVLVGPGEVKCPKCEALVQVEAGTPGWPAGMHCNGCGCSFSGTLAP